MAATVVREKKMTLPTLQVWRWLFTITPITDEIREIARQEPLMRRVISGALWLCFALAGVVISLSVAIYGVRRLRGRW
jgi:hypothetical protein